MVREPCVEYDEAKHRQNLEKRGIGFDLAARVLRDPDLICLTLPFPDEPRTMCIGCTDGKAYVVILTQRRQCIRIISMWRYGRKTYRSLLNKHMAGMIEMDEQDLEYLRLLYEAGCR